jgi:LuxR family transcriptional activator of conjugal transfer of Ti plasmids
MSANRHWWVGSESFLRQKYAPFRKLSLDGSLADVQTPLDVLAEAASEADIGHALEIFCKAHGVSKSGHVTVQESPSGLSLTSAVTYGIEDYNSAYLAENMLKLDAIRYISGNEIFPIPWGLSHQDKADFAEEKQFFSFLRDFKCGRGAIVPFRGPNYHSVLAVVVDESEKDFSARLSQFAAQTQIFGVALHAAIQRISPFFAELMAPTGPNARLSAREAECMHWAAVGKTAWEISCILSISERTVIAHTENAKKKLQARTLPQAVAIAVSSGQITV